MNIENFEDNRPFIEDEFLYAEWDVSSGLSAEELARGLETFIADNRNLPTPILRARSFEYLLSNVQIAINPHTIFADKFNIGVKYKYFASQDIFDVNFFQKLRHEILTREMPDSYNRMLKGQEIGVGFAWADFCHTLPDWNNVLKLGFSGMLDCVVIAKREKEAACMLTDEQRDFYDSIIISLNAILSYIKRVYMLSLKYNITEYSDCILHLITEPPRTLYQAMEMSILYVYMEEIGTERCRSLGAIDLLYYPYYIEDLRSGRCTEHDIREMFKYFFIHFTAAKRFAEQPFTICMTDASGNDLSNELTRLIVDVYDELCIYNPKIHVRYHQNMPRDLLLKLLDMIRRGNNSMVFINDDVVIYGYERLGIPRYLAAKYIPIGCYEPVIMGHEEAMIGASWLNMAKAVEFTLFSGRDLKSGYQFGFETPENFDNFDEFYTAFETQLGYIIDITADCLMEQGKYHIAINPSPIYSASQAACIEKGLDVYQYALDYNNISIKCFGFATVVDSLTSLKKFVFDQRIISYSEMKKVLLSDWKGYEILRHRIANDPDKFGCNRPIPDNIMQRVSDLLAKKIVNRPNNRGGVFRLGADSIRYNFHEGKKTAATPDGRHSGEALSKNLCATPGKDIKGITAYMNSLLKLDHTLYLDSGILDFMVHPTAVAGEKGLLALCDLLQTYFATGGFALQGNIINAETLIAARENPGAYRSLQVRVCGWNEYFVNLTPAVQNMFIEQAGGNNK